VWSPDRQTIPDLSNAPIPLNATDIFEPVSTELAQVEDTLRDALLSSAPEVSGVIERVSGHQGKRLRPALVLLSGQVCGPLTPQHVDLAATVELIHLASLVHDDVVDQADLRRRQQSVRSEWGNEIAVLLGDYAFSKAFSLLASLDSQGATAVLSNATSKMAEGELRQSFRRFDSSLTESEYLQIIDAKTAELFAASCRLGAMASGADRHLSGRMADYGRKLGVAFQIVDDVLDLTGDDAVVGKTLYTDLENGRLTLPLIHAMAQAPEGSSDQLRDLFFPSDGTPQKAAIAEVMAERDALSYSREVATRYCHEAKALLRSLPRTASRKSLMALADFVVERDS